jgi:tRNA U34 2-thiouridine synthase MnmA/TrmU
MALGNKFTAEIRYIKFGSLMARSNAISNGGWLATGITAFVTICGLVLIDAGHYADVLWRTDIQGQSRPTLTRCRDTAKDQTYFLASIQEAALSKVRLATNLRLQLTEYAPDNISSSLPNEAGDQSTGHQVWIFHSREEG